MSGVIARLIVVASLFTIAFSPYSCSSSRVGLDVAVNRKPGKGEFCPEPSCIDKIAKWTILGIQGKRLLSITHKPVKLTSIVIGNCVQQVEYDEKLLKKALILDVLGLKVPEIFQSKELIGTFFVEQIKIHPFIKMVSLQACPSAIVCWNECGSYSSEKTLSLVTISYAC